MPDLLDMIDEIDIEVNPPVEKPIEIEDLNPPKAPKIIDDIELDEVDTNLVSKVDNITFEEIANSSEFKRLVYLIQFGKTHRGKSVDLEKKLIKRQEEITIIKEIERGSKGAFKAVVKELKEKLAKQKVKVENGAN